MTLCDRGEGGGSAERYVTHKIIYMYKIYKNLYHVYAYLYMSCIIINICYIRVWYLVALYPMYYSLYTPM